MRKRNVTVTVDAEAYRRARIWAAERQTSVSAVVSYLIGRLPGSPLAECAAEAVQHRHPATASSPSRRPNSVDSLIRAIERLSVRLSPPPKIIPPVQLCDLPQPSSLSHLQPPNRTGTQESEPRRPTRATIRSDRRR